jgi:hypothetical protein
MRVAANRTVDGTGDGDLAAGAGAGFVLGDPRGGSVQTFNECGWAWDHGLHGVNVDVGVADPTDFIEVNRAVHVGLTHAPEYDVSPMPTFRESRHVRAGYEFTLADVFLPRAHPDTIAMGRTDFDQHGLQGTALARLGVLPYHQWSYEYSAPLGVCVPEGVEGLLVTGKAVGATKDAASFLRMQPEVQNIGFAAGVAAALAAESGKLDAGAVQERLRALGQFPEEWIGPEGVEAGAALEAYLAGDDRSLAAALCGVDGGRGTPYRFDTAKSVMDVPPGMVVSLGRELEGGDEDRRVRAACVLCWLGDARGAGLLAEALEGLWREPPTYVAEKGRSIGGFVEVADAYWRANQMIVLLGLVGASEARELLVRIAAETEAGGEPLESPRLHWRRVPHYDRVVSLTFALERLADGSCVAGLQGLLGREGFGGHFETVSLGGRETDAMAQLELCIARALARCGGRAGALRLADYVEDVRFVFADHARSELEAVTGRRLGFDAKAWRAWIGENAWAPVPVTETLRY